MNRPAVAQEPLGRGRASKGSKKTRGKDPDCCSTNDTIHGPKRFTTTLEVLSARTGIAPDDILEALKSMGAIEGIGKNPKIFLSKVKLNRNNHIAKNKSKWKNDVPYIHTVEDLRRQTKTIY